jgi:type III restriction enzyme
MSSSRWMRKSRCWTSKHLCNRMGFWMATGSGKTIVLVKLLELLHLLMRREEIPVNDVLFLTHREDLIEQFQKTIWEYNHAPDCPVHIELRELREYPEAKRESPGGLLGRDSTLRVYYYRSDNLSDEHKERIVDFHNYDNNGRWYVLLDEAHKGGQEDSKRKYIYTILSRAGFLFNFSATFTDALDLATTVHNFNLSEFITKGYGKHIAILRQELASFKNREHGRLQRRREAQGGCEEHAAAGLHGEEGGRTAEACEG